MDDDALSRIIAVVAATIAAHGDELTGLDRAIGDGDHGLNLTRGINAVAGERESYRGLPFGQALQKMGMKLVMTVGGASGPLYGSLLMAMGKAAGDRAPGSLAALAPLVEAGVAAVRTRGKSGPGEKTMLDVLIPVAAAIRRVGEEELPLATALARIATAAAEGLEATRPLQATKGRASFLGPRSVGHLDPGARSSQLLIQAICETLAASPAPASGAAAP